MKTAVSVASVALALSFAGAAAAQPLLFEDFEQPGDYQGWTVNGQEMIFPGGPGGGTFMGVPYLDFWGITLANDSAPELLRDLTRHDGDRVHISVEMRVSRLDNFFGEPMDPSHWPLVLRLIDEGDPSDPADDVSVYFVGEGCPRQEDGWRARRFTIPTFSQARLPTGWRGTGDEDPTTFEPRLPLDRTYLSVIQSVDRIECTTLQPGYFYVSSFWEAGFDNVVAWEPGCDGDFNGDGNIDQDDVAYIINVIAGGDNPNNRDPDFNDDGNTDQGDVDALVNLVAGGSCP
ncbi:MAG: hypothetical protein IT433_13165 [Phycisphaerales bacterium]|nr:hypothetical protein [Phycisphaerales bacterium]